MFAGLMGVERHNKSLLQHCDVMEGGRASGTAGSSGRKRLHRRPGCVRLQITGQEEEEEEEEEEDGSCIRNGKSGRHADVAEATSTQKLSHTTAANVSPRNKQPGRPSCSSWKSKSYIHSVTHPLPHGGCSAIHGPSGPHSLPPQNDLSLSPCPTPRCSTQDVFSSSFSFIQRSLSLRQTTDTTTPPEEPEPLREPSKAPSSPQTKPVNSSDQHVSKRPTPVRSEASSAPNSQPGVQDVTFWSECLWDGMEVQADPADSDCLDIEITSSLSVDSDAASASSVTSGYESATPAWDQGRDSLVKKYEVVLQGCLQNNRAHTKIESMMSKLQRLQQKAISDDDYDAAERFGKKLDELCQERDALKPGLPSRQPSVARFLQRLRQVVDSVLQRADSGQCREGAGEQHAARLGPLHQKLHLTQQKGLLEEEIAELQLRLTELRDRRRRLEQQIQQEEQQAEAEELEGSVLQSCTVAQLRSMSRTLQDLAASENRTQISVSPPPSTLRLQEQEQALNLSIKEATAKVVMGQRLGSSLRRKVSETETQLLALHEAKLAAVSGNDFSSAKELKAEMEAVFLEKDRLEALAKRLHSLSSGSSQELARMKEQRQELRQELQQEEAQHESRLKANTTKYMKLLEDRLHSCGCPGLERIWEADLEACHLFLRGLQLQTPSCNGADIDVLPVAAVYLPPQPCTKEEDEEDCAMLTALGGCWCPEANLQNSEFTKKLEEFLFCMEDNHPEDGCSEAEAADLTERCELIGDRLMTLEDELHTAILSQDQPLTRSLEKEVREVKATLQTMLAQLKGEEDEEEEDVSEVEDDDLMKNGTEEEEEEEEDQYFSDSWDI
ncbi:disrupted in schizophrenia 1 protein [Brachionichthys hirsutus]|uniref:disrupted in schizophrenia 1 protein n=1 Tax=Brachionichthys hirsutus TaxID=412623 RepID=UPI003604528A